MNSLKPKSIILDQSSIQILEDILRSTTVTPEGVDAVCYRAQHEDQLDLLDKLERDACLREDHEKYLVTLYGLSVLAAPWVKDLLERCEKVFSVLRTHYKTKPREHIRVADLAPLAGLTLLETKECLSYMIQGSWWSSHNLQSQNPDEARLQPSESILKYKTFQEVIMEFWRWRDARSSREKVRGPAPTTRKSSLLKHIGGWFLTTTGKIVIGVIIVVLGAWAIAVWGPQSRGLQTKGQAARIQLEKAKFEVYQDDSTGKSWRVCHLPVQIYNATASTLSIPYWKLTDLRRLENGSFSPWGEVDTLMLAWPRTVPRKISPGDTVSVPFARILPAELQKLLGEDRLYSGNPDMPQLRFNVVDGGWSRRMTSHIPPGTYRFTLTVFFEQELPAKVDIELEWAGEQRENIELMAQEIKLRKLVN